MMKRALLLSPLLALGLAGCGGGVFERRVDGIATLQQTATPALVLYITRDNQNPTIGEGCYTNVPNPPDWCRNSGVGAIGFTVNPSNRPYKIWVYNPGTADAVGGVQLIRDNQNEGGNTKPVPAGVAVAFWEVNTGNARRL